MRLTIAIIKNENHETINGATSAFKKEEKAKAYIEKLTKVHKNFYGELQTINTDVEGYKT